MSASPTLLDFVRTPSGHVGRITEMSFSRDGSFARVGSEGKRWWRLSALELQEIPAREAE